MPLYDYRCESCLEISELMLSISALDNQQYCPHCHGKMKRKFHSLGVVHQGRVKGIGITRDPKEAEEYMYKNIVEEHEKG